MPTRALDEAPSLVIETPAAGSLQLAAEVDVSGRFHTATGAGWLWVDGTQAELHAGHFLAHHVPLREGPIELSIELTDAAGRKTHTTLPLVVETHDRPRSASLCHGAVCTHYETRGVPHRDVHGRIDNAVVVVSAYGFGEKLDALWPGLVGPGRALDSRMRFIVGVAAEPSADVLALLDELRLAPTTPLVGASTYGAELVLRLVARASTWTGAVLICGGHDRPFSEDVLKAVRKALMEDDPWPRVVHVMVPASYTPAYFGELRHAGEHGLVEEAKAHGLLGALETAQILAPHPQLDELRRRLDGTFALEDRPLTFERLEGRRIFLVENAQDRLSTLGHVKQLADRLRTAGANVQLRTFDDDHGHAAYFRHVAPVLEQALIELTSP